MDAIETGGECSNRKEVGEGTRRTACACKRNRITSVAAIVAPQLCDLVRGAFVLEARARPACLFVVFFDSYVRLFPSNGRLCIS